jgi:hypothetical protein
MRIRNTAAALVIAALALVGCGGSGGAKSGGRTNHATTTERRSPETERRSPEKVLADAARRTLAAGTARYALEVRSSVRGRKPSTAKATGVIDFESSRSQLDMTFESSGRKLAFRVIYDRGMLYEKLPPELAGTSGKRWIKLDLTDALGGANAQLNPNDPGGTVAFLYGANGVTQAGPELVRGVATTCYMGSLDPKRAVEQLPPEYRDKYVNSLEEVGAAGPMPAELWIDGQDLIRRIELSGTATVKGRQSTTKTTIEYFAFGAPVDIKLPPADQVQ